MLNSVVFISIAPDSQRYPHKYFSMKTYVTLGNTETLIVSTHNIYFCGEMSIDFAIKFPYLELWSCLGQHHLQKDSGTEGNRRLKAESLSC